MYWSKKIMRLITVLIVLAGCVSLIAPRCIHAQEPASVATPLWDTLAGELPAIVKNTGRPYFVAADIIVPPGKTVVIEPGTILLFHTFSGLQVHGVLLARGRENAPILFSSENDGSHGGLTNPAPAPYDWNGITIYENALGTSFFFCNVTYSLFGINSLCSQICLKSCRFSQNGKAEFTVLGERQSVADAPFSWGEQTAAGVDKVHSRALAQKLVLRIGGFGLLAAGGAVGVWKTMDYPASRDKFNKLNDTASYINKKNPAIINEWNTAKTTVNRNSALMIGGYALAVIGAIGIGFSFAW
jgi:hypothetical protein